MRPDDGEHHVAGADVVGEVGTEVDAGRDRIDVLEHLRNPEALCEPIIEPARHVSAVVAAIRQEHFQISHVDLPQ